MRRYHLTAPGLDHLVLREEAPPAPSAGEIVMRPRCVSLNARDLMVLHGYLPNAKPDLTPLSDGAGEVIAVGAGVEQLKPGDRVVAAFRPAWTDGPPEPYQATSDLGGPADGVLGEWVLLPEAGVVKLPEHVSLEAAASLPCAGVTAWRSLTGGRPLRADETVLVQGTGGVSLFALAIARNFGCRVIATTSSDAKADILRRLGAETVIDYTRTPDWQIEVMKATGGRGVDRIVEVGGPGTLPRSMACIAPLGEIAFVGMQDDPGGQVSPIPLIGRCASIRGIAVGSVADLATLLAEVAAGRLAPVIDQTFAFEAAADAYRRLQGRQHVGKVLISVL
ncbi:MAG: NAD(P)-dependent alcohol dehydrogenase [Caulobacteraceae bacterium]|nr:NAD(P)-dependent alcohol dehydrogenase [Caulobacteraceae bacterium]